MGHPSSRAAPSYASMMMHSYPCHSLEEAKATLVAISLGTDIECRKFYAAAQIVAQETIAYNTVVFMNCILYDHMREAAAKLLETLAHQEEHYRGNNPHNG